ncbi:MAG: hypothetical protein K2N98_11695, partial [Lachnospiraceae bacterium]|nr:hypothetical protein [Lachnospiraceae bacterium]
MSIRITGMFSGLDTESIISELVSAQSVKKNSLVKAQTKLSWKQDAWKALNTKIYSFYTNTLSDMRYQGSYMKKITKVSNTNAISVLTSDSAVDGVRSVMVNQLAKGARLTSGALNSKSGVYFSGAASLAQLRNNRGMDVFEDDYKSKSVTGSFRVVGAQGQYVDFNVNENTTINDIVNMIKTTGLNANYDQENQRIFISSKNTGEINNFNLVANDEGGMNALALLGLLSKDDLTSDENKKWAAYQNADGSYTTDYYNDLSAEITKRLDALLAANEELKKQNGDLKDANDKLAQDNADLLNSLTAADFSALSSLGTLKSGKTISQALTDLYGAGGTGGIYDTIAGKKTAYTEAQTALQKAQEAYDAIKDSNDATQADKDAAQAALTAAQTAHDTAKADYDTAQGAYNEISDFINDVVYGKLENKEIQGLANSAHAGTYYQLQNENGKALNVYEKLDSNKAGIGEYYAADGTLLYKKRSDGSYEDGAGNLLSQDDQGNYLDKDGNIIANCTYVQERGGGLKAAYEEAEKNGTVTSAMKEQVEAINKLNDVFLTVGKNKTSIAANADKIAANEATITSNNEYLTDAEDTDDVDGMGVGTSKLAQDVQTQFEAKVEAAKKALAIAGDPDANAGMLAGSKVTAQDAKILIDGAEFTSMTNTFSVN